MTKKKKLQIQNIEGGVLKTGVASLHFTKTFVLLKT